MNGGEGNESVTLQRLLDKKLFLMSASPQSTLGMAGATQTRLTAHRAGDPSNLGMCTKALGG